MELTTKEIELLNNILPPSFSIEPAPAISQQNPSHSNSETFSFKLSIPQRLPYKRPIREKRPVNYEEIDPRFKQGTAYKKLYVLFQRIRKHPKLYPFLHSSITTNSGEVLDMSRIENNLRIGKYETGYHLALDLRVIWSHWFSQATHSEMHQTALELSNFTEELLHSSIHLVLFDKTNQIEDLSRKIDRLTHRLHVLQNQEQKPPVKRLMSQNEQKALQLNLNKLDSYYFKGAMNIIAKYSLWNIGEFKIELDQLPYSVCKELDSYVKRAIQQMNRAIKIQKQAEQLGQIDQNTSFSSQIVPPTPQSESSSDDGIPQPLNESQDTLYGKIGSNQLEHDELGFGTILDIEHSHDFFSS